MHKCRHKGWEAPRHRPRASTLRRLGAHESKRQQKMWARTGACKCACVRACVFASAPARDVLVNVCTSLRRCRHKGWEAHSHRPCASTLSRLDAHEFTCQQRACESSVVRAHALVHVPARLRLHLCVQTHVHRSTSCTRPRCICTRSVLKRPHDVPCPDC